MSTQRQYFVVLGYVVFFEKLGRKDDTMAESSDNYKLSWVLYSSLFSKKDLQRAYIVKSCPFYLVSLAVSFEIKLTSARLEIEIKLRLDFGKKWGKRNASRLTSGKL